MIVTRASTLVTPLGSIMVQMQFRITIHVPERVDTRSILFMLLLIVFRTITHDRHSRHPVLKIGSASSFVES